MSIQRYHTKSSLLSDNAVNPLGQRMQHIQLDDPRLPDSNGFLTTFNTDHLAEALVNTTGSGFYRAWKRRTEADLQLCFPLMPFYLTAILRYDTETNKILSIRPQLIQTMRGQKEAIIEKNRMIVVDKASSTIMEHWQRFQLPNGSTKWFCTKKRRMRDTPMDYSLYRPANAEVWLRLVLNKLTYIHQQLKEDSGFTTPFSNDFAVTLKRLGVLQDVDLSTEEVTDDMLEALSCLSRCDPYEMTVNRMRREGLDIQLDRVDLMARGWLERATV